MSQEAITLGLLEAMRQQKIEEYRQAILTGNVVAPGTQPAATRSIRDKMAQRRQQLSNQFTNGLDPLAYSRAINPGFTFSKRLYYGSA